MPPDRRDSRACSTSPWRPPGWSGYLRPPGFALAGFARPDSRADRQCLAAARHRVPFALRASKASCRVRSQIGFETCPANPEPLQTLPIASRGRNPSSARALYLSIAGRPRSASPTSPHPCRAGSYPVTRFGKVQPSRQPGGESPGRRFRPWILPGGNPRSEESAHQRPVRGVIVHDQDLCVSQAWLHFGHWRAGRGCFSRTAVNQNVDPLPSSLSTPIRPPNISTSCLEIVRPKPGAAVSTRPGPIRLDERLEEGGGSVLPEADARIAHGEAQGGRAFVLGLESHPDGDFALWRELHGVAHRFTRTWRSRPGSPRRRQGVPGSNSQISSSPFPMP